MIESTPGTSAMALSRLTHNRWALRVLAFVAQRGGCKLVTLCRALDASPASLKRALVRLAELDLVIPNPGYGHPMRPEYILGSAGLNARELPVEIVEWTQRVVAAEPLYKKWQLPVLVALSPQTQRFGEVRRQLAGMTPRALTLALKSHTALGLVVRDVDHGYPPVPRYSPSTLALAGREPALQLGELLAQRSDALADVTRADPR